MFTYVLQKDKQTRRFTIQADDGRWKLLEEHNDRVVKRMTYNDWHKVERARSVFLQDAEELRSHGWTELQPLPRPHAP